MKKLISISILLTACAATLLTLYAQSVPVTVTAFWNPNPSTDNVINYTLTLDNNSPITVPPAIIQSCNCIRQQITVNSLGQHTLVLTATNSWGVSDPLTLTFIVARPSQPTQLNLNVTTP